MLDFEKYAYQSDLKSRNHQLEKLAKRERTTARKAMRSRLATCVNTYKALPCVDVRVATVDCFIWNIENHSYIDGPLSSLLELSFVLQDMRDGHKLDSYLICEGLTTFRSCADRTFVDGERLTDHDGHRFRDNTAKWLEPTARGMRLEYCRDISNQSHASD